MQNSTPVVSSKQLAALFLKLGTIGFGGPAAHIALMRDEVVGKKQWISKEEFQDLVGATNLIPGPNSTELAIHIGQRLLGKKGFILAGVCFILPAFFSVLGLSVFYKDYGKLLEVNSILSGIRPVIVAIVLLALVKFRETSVRNRSEAVVALLSVFLVFLGIGELEIILLSGVLMLSRGTAGFYSLALASTQLPAESLTTKSLFFYFFKLGSVLFGSGYVLLAFIQKELVVDRGWLTSAQLLDAISVGQITPGPVFTTATFIGYLLAGHAGAFLATIGIFLPAFVFVAVSSPYIVRMRESQTYSRFLNGVNASSFALLVFVSIDLARKSLSSLPALLIFFVALSVLKFTRVNSAWVILGFAIIGFFFFR